MTVTIRRSALAKVAAISTAAVCSLSLVACGGSDMGAGASPSAGGASSAPMSSAPASPMGSSSAQGSMTEPFGSGCAAVPKSGSGSFDGMSQDPVATAASNNPALSTLVGAVKKAKLVDTLNSAEDITVFAPSNDAFKKLDEKTLKAAMADPNGLLSDVLTMHVVSGRLSPDQVAGEHQTLNKKQKIEVTGSGENFTVNGKAKVVCGNVQTANATVYIIDGVLLPKS